MKLLCHLSQNSIKPTSIKQDSSLDFEMGRTRSKFSFSLNRSEEFQTEFMFLHTPGGGPINLFSYHFIFAPRVFRLTWYALVKSSCSPGNRR